MPLIRGHHDFDDHYTQVPNDWVRDPRLSLKARGLLVYLMSHRPGWNMSIRSIARANYVGPDQIKTAVEELEAHGYLVRGQKQNRTESGTFADWEWTTSDPFASTVTGKSVHGKSRRGETEHKEEHSSKNNTSQNLPQPSVGGEIDERFEEFWAVYPRRVEKLDARKAFAKQWPKFGQEILVGARRMAADPNLPEKRFIPYPASWLNAGGWDSEPYPPRERTPEELAEEARRKRERIREIEERERQERAEREKRAVPAPDCEEHGIPIYKCVPCTTRMAKEAGML